VALRQVQDPVLAQDVAQAVFLLLAQKAARLGRTVVVSGWLFQTTRFVAARVRRTEQRRQRREQEALKMAQLNATHDAEHDLAPAVDDALAQMGETDRNALLLRFVEGRSYREVAAALGVSEEAAKKRGQRALQTLRGLLGRSGVAVSAAALGSFLGERLNAAPPPGLEAGVVAQLTAPASGAGAAGGLVRDVQAAWNAARRRWVGWGLAGALMLIGIGRLAPWPAPARNDAGSLNAAPAAATANAETALAVASPVEPTETLPVRVVSADDESPLAGVQILAQFVADGDWRYRDDLFTGDDGVCKVPLPSGTLQRLDVGAHAPGWGNRFFTWMQRWQDPRPASYVLRLQRTGSLGGIVRDSLHRPVQGVEVWVQYGISDTSWREPREDRERVGLMRRAKVATTDPEGRWVCSVVPEDRANFYFEFEHPDFALTTVRCQRDGTDSQILDSLRARTAMTILEPGYAIHGSVADQKGNPVAEARVAPSWHQAGAVTDANGTFVLPRFPRGRHELIVTANGFAPLPFETDAGGKPVYLRLSPGVVLRVRVMTADGTPIPGARLGLDDAFGLSRLGWEGRTDEEGRLAWDGAPFDQPLRFHVHADGFAMLRMIPLEANGIEQGVTLRPERRVRGRVVDAATREPVAAFKAIPGSDRSELWYGTNGAYQLRFSESNEPTVMIEAEGYETVVGTPQPDAGGEFRCDFHLQRMSSLVPLRGTVRGPDGLPTAGAEILLVTLDRGVEIQKGGRLKVSLGGSPSRTDTEGRFELPRDSRAHTVVASSPEGFARIRVRNFDEALEISLQPWGQIHGLLQLAGEAPSLGRVTLNDLSFAGRNSGISLNWSASTSADGAFHFPGVPPGMYQVHHFRGIGEAGGRSALVKVAAGETASVQIGGDGRRVFGRLQAKPGVGLTNWNLQVAAARLGVRPSPAQGPFLQSTDDLEAWHRQADAWEDPEAQATFVASNVFPLDVEADGSFHAEDIPPGEYGLIVDLGTAGGTQAKSAGDPWTARRGPRLRASIVVPSPEQGAEASPWDLGLLTLEGERTAAARPR